MTSKSQLAGPRRQRTLACAATVSGFGYWSGRDVRVEFRPAEPNTGIVFVREDLGQARIPANLKYRIESPRRTTLRSGGASVEMVEHIMAALAGLQVDNCEVWVTAAEMPGCDGSSIEFVQALDAAGYVTQAPLRPQLIIAEPLRVGDDSAWIEARPSGSQAGLTVRFHIDYGSTGGIGRQTCRFAVTPEVFRAELAPCRTFVLKAEADWLQSQGLAKRPTHKDLLIFDDEGPIDNPLRMADECVRHKALDLVGDLALVGADIVGQVSGHLSGHRQNAEMAKAISVEGRAAGQFGRAG